MQFLLSEDGQYIHIVNHHKRTFKYLVQDVKFINYIDEHYVDEENQDSKLGSIFILANQGAEDPMIFELQLETGYKMRLWMVYALTREDVKSTEFVAKEEANEG